MGKYRLARLGLPAAVILGIAALVPIRADDVFAHDALLIVSS